MEDCMRYCDEIKDLMVDLCDAIDKEDTERVEEIIATCRCALNDIEENMPCEDDEEDENEDDEDKYDENGEYDAWGGYEG